MSLPANAHTRRTLAVLASLLALLALLALTWWVYYPGLSGDFLFDDFANLPTIGATGPIDNWAAFWRYITSGTADPTGRPLTLLTFLIDAHNWPASPYPFKVTNVILHLINGALLAWVLWKLGTFLLPPPSGSAWHVEGASKTIPSTSGRGGAKRTRAQRDHVAPGEGPGSRKCAVPSSPTPLPKGDGSKAVPSPVTPPATGKGKKRGLFALDNRGVAIAALFGAGAWLLHPLLVSTTLYIVQREAMLPATFVLIAILGWMASREALAHGHVKRAMAGMALSVWLCTGLAVLSKANGALLPFLLLLIEWIVLSRHPMLTHVQRWHRRAVVVLLIIPCSLVIAYLLYLIPGFVRSTPPIRGWTVGQRLLTEPRVLTDYLHLLFVPHAHSTGLFNDDFPLSTSWLHPVSTIPCIVLILSLIVAGFTLRKNHPAIALALLFYFAAQLMESGWIPLELYFEHRNYLPAMLLFWPIGLVLGQSGTLRFLRVGVAAVILVAIAILTAQRTAVWGDGFRQAQVWAAINPDSARAQTNAALYDLAHDRPRLAAARLRLSIPRHPDNIQAPITLVNAECKLGGVKPATLVAAEDALEHTRTGGETAFKWFDSALDMAILHACPGLDFAAVQTALDAVKRNLYWRSQRWRQQSLDHLQAQLDLAEGKSNIALQLFNRALLAAPTPGSALQQAAYLGAHGYPKLGLEHLGYYARLPPGPDPGFGMPRIHAWVLRMQDWWPKETAYLRKNLEEDATAKRNDDRSNVTGQEQSRGGVDHLQ